MNNSLPIIIHIAAYYPPHTGGLERVAQMCAEECSERGYPVEVITTTQSNRKRGIEKNGNLMITTLSSFEFAHTPIAPTFLVHMFRIPKNSIIHLHLSQAYFPELVMLVAKLRGIPYVVHFHLDVGTSGIFGPVFLLYKKLLWGPLMRGAERVIACASDQLEIIPKKFNVPKEKISVILNAVSDDFFSDRAYTPPTKEFRLLYVGRLAPQKRVERIVEAMSKISIPAHLTIVGDGEDLPKLETLVRELKLTNISFEGKRSDAEMQKYHREHDAFLICSDREGTPLVVLEAMAGRLPVVGSDVVGTRSVVDGVGVLVKEPYPQNFAQAIEGLWNNPEKLIVLSKQSFEKAQQYKWSRFIDELEAVYKTI